MLKRKYFSLLVIIFIFILLYTQLVSAKPFDLMGEIITIDPGHGGRDSGTLYGDTLEKELNLEISRHLETELTKNGAITYMTRSSDIDLSSIYDSRKKRGDLYRRILAIKENKSSLYLSIHINWYHNTKYKGAEVLYNPINKNNEILAKEIMNAFKEDLKSTRNIKQTDLYMYKNTTVPGVLIECGYLSNPYERNLLSQSEYQKKIAESITKGVKSYIKKINKDKYVL